jgi:predicted RNA-binding protein with PUA-like domain
MKHWLMKSEPDECSIDDVLKAPGRKTPWSGVRNYQARNYMRDEMRVGDGLAEIASAPYPDASQFDRKSDYFDPKSKKDAPRWFNVDVKALRKTRLMPLTEIRTHKPLAGMVLLRPGNRLSITPVTATEWNYIVGKLL